MKKRIGFLAVAVAGCVVFLSACSSSGGANKIPLNSNWYSLTSYKGIQPTITEGNDRFKAEKLVYDVKFKAPEAVGNSSYSVEYADGAYTTLFYAKAFDVSALTYSEYRQEYTAAANDNGEIIAYYFRTELDLPSVTYRFGNDSKTFENDKTVTECYFLSCGDYLRPLYSRQEIVSASPASYTASDIDSTYIYVDRIYENFYNYAGTEVYTEITDNLDKNNNAKIKTGLSGASTSLFDYSQLSIVIRAMSNLTSSLSQNVSIFSPNKGVMNYTLTGYSTALGDEERGAITEILAQSGLYNHKTDLEEGETDTVDTVAVSVNYNGDMTGVTPTYWYAAIDNKNNNTGRATLLKMSVPLTYRVGTLEYTLSEVTESLWNG